MRFLPVRAEWFSLISLPIGIGLAFHGYLGPPRTHASPVADSRQAATSYSVDIAPIFHARCVKCHGGLNEATGEREMKHGLDLTTYEGLMAGSEDGPVIEPGDPESSLLIDMIVQGDMPQDGDLVPPQEVEMIREWIAEGALNDVAP